MLMRHSRCNRGIEYYPVEHIGVNNDQIFIYDGNKISKSYALFLHLALGLLSGNKKY